MFCVECLKSYIVRISDTYYTMDAWNLDVRKPDLKLEAIFPRLGDKHVQYLDAKLSHNPEIASLGHFAIWKNLLF